jgi:serine/threonine protein kinase
MELMSGGDLFDRIGKRKTYTENDARNLCRNMLESVRYCHENSVAHCDMKPKNLLLADDDDDVNVKLSDFGFATRVYEPNSLNRQCGTPFFVSPEVLMQSPYDQQSDMWSVGVIIYLLLGGDLPFMGRTQKELFRSIVLCEYDFPEESWSHVSDEAKDLVKKLLVTDPGKRLTSQAAMQSPWMQQGNNLLEKIDLEYTSRRLKTFNARMKLRSSMIAVTLITSAKLSVSKKIGMIANSDRSLNSEESQGEETAAKKLPSFLDLPEEKNDTY